MRIKIAKYMCARNIYLVKKKRYTARIIIIDVSLYLLEFHIVKFNDANGSI